MSSTSKVFDEFMKVPIGDLKRDDRSKDIIETIYHVVNDKKSQILDRLRREGSYFKRIGQREEQIYYSNLVKRLPGERPPLPVVPAPAPAPKPAPAQRKFYGAKDADEHSFGKSGFGGSKKSRRSRKSKRSRKSRKSKRSRKSKKSKRSRKSKRSKSRK